MSAHDAAPEVPAKDPSGGGYIDGGAETLPDSLPAVIRQRLAAEGIRTFADWLALGERRYQLWGITKATVALIDRVWGRP